MPTYEYRCTSCGHLFERVQRITEDPIKECASCSAPRAERVISAPSFVLKGGGWYADGYSSRKDKPSSESSSDGAKKSDAVA